MRRAEGGRAIINILLGPVREGWFKLENSNKMLLGYKCLLARCERVVLKNIAALRVWDG